jgi:hypothetical protein
VKLYAPEMFRVQYCQQVETCVVGCLPLMVCTLILHRPELQPFVAGCQSACFVLYEKAFGFTYLWVWSSPQTHLWHELAVGD